MEQKKITPKITKKILSPKERKIQFEAGMKQRGNICCFKCKKVAGVKYQYKRRSGETFVRGITIKKYRPDPTKYICTDCEE